MKRVEAINLINELLIEMTDGYLISNHFAKEILKKLEGSGMLPPKTKKKKFDDILGVYYYENVHGWEDEV